MIDSKFSRAWIAAWVVAVTLSGARAFGMPAQQPAAPPQVSDDLRPAEIQRLFDALVAVQARERLALSDAQYPEFLTRLMQLQAARKRNQQAREKLVGELGRLTNPKNAFVDEGAVANRLKELRELEVSAAADLRNAYDAIDQVLDLRQQARFRVFEQQIEQRKIEMFLRARRVNRERARQNQPG